MLFTSAIPALADSAAEVHSIPTLDKFVNKLVNGHADQLRGVFVPDKFAFTIEQQPKNSPMYISKDPKKVTEMKALWNEGVIGLLAHSSLAGKHFFELHRRERIFLIYGDGHTQEYIVTSIKNYEVIDAVNSMEWYRDVETKEYLRSNQLFANMYGGSEHVTFQTCISSGDNNEWGRLFVIATPVVNGTVHAAPSWAARSILEY
jgi:hypothetical protein